MLQCAIGDEILFVVWLLLWSRRRSSSSGSWIYSQRICDAFWHIPFFEVAFICAFFLRLWLVWLSMCGYGPVHIVQPYHNKVAKDKMDVASAQSNQHFLLEWTWPYGQRPSDNTDKHARLACVFSKNKYECIHNGTQRRHLHVHPNCFVFGLSLCKCNYPNSIENLPRFCTCVHSSMLHAHHSATPQFHTSLSSPSSAIGSVYVCSLASLLSWKLNWTALAMPSCLNWTGAHFFTNEYAS